MSTGAEMDLCVCLLRKGALGLNALWKCNRPFSLKHSHSDFAATNDWTVPLFRPSLLLLYFEFMVYVWSAQNVERRRQFQTAQTQLEQYTEKVLCLCSKVKAICLLSACVA
jgi:hypothetical protein